MVAWAGGVVAGFGDGDLPLARALADISSASLALWKRCQSSKIPKDSPPYHIFQKGAVMADKEQRAIEFLQQCLQ